MKKFNKCISFILCFCMLCSLIIGTDATLVKATNLEDLTVCAEETDDILVTPEVSPVDVNVQMPGGRTITVWYRLDDRGWQDWQDGTSGISIPDTATNMEILLGEGTQDNYTIQLMDNGNLEISPISIQSQTAYSASTPTSGPASGSVVFWNAKFTDGGVHNFQIEIEPTGGAGGPGPGPSSPGDVRFCIRDNPEGAEFTMRQMQMVLGHGRMIILCSLLRN